MGWPVGEGLRARARDIPRAGRYRLYRWAKPRTYEPRRGKRRPLRLQCRACWRFLKVENQWAHLDTEVRRRGSVEALAAVLALRSAQRRSKARLRYARYEYQVGIEEPGRFKELLGPEEEDGGKE